jgi:HNH endonuclease
VPASPASGGPVPPAPAPAGRGAARPGRCPPRHCAGCSTPCSPTPRTCSPAPPAISLPLDAGEATSTVPAHLRRLVTTRDRHCAAPGCTQPPAACHVHHIIPRADGGPTTLGNLVLLCSFHHLIAVHRWGWTITLNPDGTTTMRNPDGSKTFHSHSPPTATAV